MNERDVHPGEQAAGAAAWLDRMAELEEERLVYEPIGACLREGRG